MIASGWRATSDFERDDLSLWDEIAIDDLDHLGPVRFQRRKDSAQLEPGPVAAERMYDDGNGVPRLPGDFGLRRRDLEQVGRGGKLAVWPEACDRCQPVDLPRLALPHRLANCPFHIRRSPLVLPRA